MRAARSLGVWMAYLRKLTLDVNGRMGKWRLNLGASTRLVTCGAMGHQLEQDRMVFPCVVAPLTLIQCTLYIHMLVRDDIVALENKIELVSPVNYRILVNYDW